MNTLSSALFFMLKKVRNRTNFHITYYSGLVRVIPKPFGPRTSICKSLLSQTPILLHQFSAQPMRKDKTNPKINNTKSVKKINAYNRHTIFP